MSLSGNTSSFSVAADEWPPGFRFHPTDEELVLYYLKRKICHHPIKLDAIAEIDVYKADPEELPGLSKLKNGDRQWFFFGPRDRKYPNGGRSNRATRHGYWKATGKDRVITYGSRSVGIKKTLVFYKGRARSGERTDWVMHEYTMDEEELKRCPAQDYYALYKVYKKSGPGPKNGEQYGAPFREEDWADDVEAIDSVDTAKVDPLLQFSHPASIDNTGTNCQAQTQISGLDEFLNQVANDLLFEPISEAFGTVQAAGGDEETHGTSVDQSFVEANVQERGFINPPCGQFNNSQPCFNPTQSDNSQFQETSEVTLASNINRLVSHNSEEGLLEDFLELDDLIVPELTNQNIENPVGNLQIEGFDGLCELDFFQDVSTDLQNAAETVSFTYNNNLGSQICNSIPILSPNNLENGVVDQVPNSYFNNFQSEMVQPISQPYHDIVGNEMVNQFNFQVPHDSDVSSQLWMHNQNFSMATPAVPNQGSIIPPTSGVIYDGVNQNQFQNQNRNQTHIQNQIVKGNEGGQSWFSSSLWSFLETIPTTPASAAESTVLVNKAFERLSSFGRRGESVKVSKLNTSANADNLTVCHRRYWNGYNRGFLLFSVFGVLCAILWVFTVTSVGVSGRCLS